MGKTKSGVCDFTQNFWVGCQPVSEGCLHCYARAACSKYDRDFNKLVRTKTWDEPLKLQRKAAKERKVLKIFTSSWSDFFHPAADQWRAEAWNIIRRTPNLLWQVLTKRAECIADRLPEDWGEGYPNVCLGVTVELKKYLWRMDTLRKIPAKARYVMAEPLLEDLMPDIGQHIEGFDQLMVGGESGNGTMDFRPMDEQWARNLRDMCKAHNIAFYFKQHAGKYSQSCPTLDGVKHQKFPAVWEKYKPAYVPPGPPGQLDLEEVLCQLQ
jgi:protein gp37